MNLLDMLKAVKSRSDEGTDDEVKAWLNEGYLNLATYIKIPAEATVALENGVSVYQLPSNFIQLDSVKLKGEFIPKANYEDTDDIVSGIPYVYYKRGNILGFYPVPQSDEELEVTIYYYKYPDELAEDSDIPDAKIPLAFHGAIVNFAIARSMEAEEEIQQAGYYMNQFEKARTEFVAMVNDDDSTNSVIEVI